MFKFLNNLYENEYVGFLFNINFYVSVFWAAYFLAEDKFLYGIGFILWTVFSFFCPFVLVIVAFHIEQKRNDTIIEQNQIKSNVCSPQKQINWKKIGF